MTQKHPKRGCNHFYNKQRRCMICHELEPQDPRLKQRTQDTVKEGYLNE